VEAIVRHVSTLGPGYNATMQALHSIRHKYVMRHGPNQGCHVHWQIWMGLTGSCTPLCALWKRRSADTFPQNVKETPYDGTNRGS